jgi:hypothetical protein
MFDIGEGGAICLNCSNDHFLRYLVLWKKGIKRYDFMTGKIDKYVIRVVHEIIKENSSNTYYF